VILGIDASNLRAGGGVTHLVELLRAAIPAEQGFERVIVWSGAKTLAHLEDRPWLEKAYLPVLDKGLAQRAFWQRFRLSSLARSAGCDVLLVPGGSYAGNFRPAVSMSRNLLPFEWRELRRFGWSWLAVKSALLRMTQSRTFRQADGVIFLTQYAHDVVMGVIGRARGRRTIIPHGVDTRFLMPPRAQRLLSECTAERPLRVLYVSIVDFYKHQWNVAEGVAQLHAEGIPIALTLVGPARPSALAHLRRTLDRLDRAGQFIRYAGAVPHHELHEWYREADVCLFASSCENMPNILLEGMAAGLPIACSKLGPMPEVLGDAGVYFDPEDPRDIARALRELVVSSALRDRLARASFERVGVYSWQRCARETLTFRASLTRAAG
jgi:glycosyltransferase involved in cell wall biosynthesis